MLEELSFNVSSWNTVQSRDPVTGDPNTIVEETKAEPETTDTCSIHRLILTITLATVIAGLLIAIVVIACHKKRMCSSRCCHKTDQLCLSSQNQTLDVQAVHVSPPDQRECCV